MLAAPEANLTSVGVGAAIGFAVLWADALLKARGSSFRMYLMPIAVGIYLPFGLALPILLGGVLAHLWSRGQTEEQADATLQRGVLFSSGVIAGEALLGVGFK